MDKNKQESFKKQLMVSALNEDYDTFRQLQKEYKKKGHDMSALFHDLIECYNKLKGGF